MKKLIAILLLVAMSIGLCACNGGSPAASSNEIRLTLDNYDDYLKLSGFSGVSGVVEADRSYWFGAYYNGGHLVTDDFGNSIRGYLTAKPTSQNFVFRDVTVTVRFTGKVPMFSLSTNPDDPDVTFFTYSFEGTFELNAGGTAKDSDVHYPAPNGKVLLPTGSNDAGMYKDTSTNDYEIIAISGTVSPA